MKKKVKKLYEASHTKKVHTFFKYSLLVLHTPLYCFEYINRTIIIIIIMPVQRKKRKISIKKWKKSNCLRYIYWYLHIFSSSSFRYVIVVATAAGFQQNGIIRESKIRVLLKSTPTCCFFLLSHIYPLTHRSSSSAYFYNSGVMMVWMLLRDANGTYMLLQFAIHNNIFFCLINFRVNVYC